MKKFLIFIFATAVISITGCKKYNGTLPITGIGETDSYTPVTKGSTWLYLDTYSGITDTLSIKMTGQMQLINKKPYYEFTSYSKSNGANIGFYFAANHKFYVRQVSPTADIMMDLEVLVDTAKTGTAWAFSPTPEGDVDGIPAVTADTVLQTGITKKIDSVTYSDVIHTRVSLLYNFGTGFQNQATYEYYFSKGIGLIEADTYVLGTLIESKKLLSYTVK